MLIEFDTDGYGRPPRTTGMESPEIERRCHVLIGLGLTLLTAGIGLDVLVGGGLQRS